MNQPACPHCGQKLESSEVGSGQLRCTGCQGLFVPAEEVREQMLHGAEPVRIAQAEAGTPAAPPANLAAECPGCRQPMTRMRWAEIQFSRCAACAGIWLDAGQDLAGLARALSPARWLLYALSLPERALRTTAGVAAGMAKELADLVVPRAFHNSSTYTILVRNSLRFLVHDVGGVLVTDQQQNSGLDNFVARKAVGNFIDLAGLSTLHLSPLLVLAVVSDLAYGSKAYLKELAAELQGQGVIASDSTIAGIDDLLEAVGRATGTTAQLFDTPPLSVDELRATTGAIRAALRALEPTQAIPLVEVRRVWDEMRSLAAKENVGLFQLSSAVTLHALSKIVQAGRGTLTGLSLASSMVNRHILGHYAQALDDIRRKGLYATLSEVSGPYVAAVWNNFSLQRASVTEDVLGGSAISRGWRKLRGWLRRKPADGDATQGNERAGYR